MRRLLPVVALAAVLASSGCIAMMPSDENPVHMDIKWRRGFDSARKESAKTRKPLLLVTAAGDLTGHC